MSNSTNNTQTKSSINIAIVIMKYNDFGGLQKVMRSFAQYMHENGHSVNVITSVWDSAEKPAFPVHIISPKAKSNHTRLLEFSEMLQQHCSTTTYDVVVGYDKMPYLNYYFQGDVCYQEYIATTRPSIIKLLPRFKAFKKLESAVFSLSSKTHTFLLSNKQKEYYQKWYNTQENRFHLMPPTVEFKPQSFDQSPNLRAQYNIALDAPLILCVGSNFYRKGYDRAIKALPLLDNNKAVLIIIGQDKKAQKYLKLAKKLGVEQRVKCVGIQTNVPEWMNQSDLFIHTARLENTGNTIIEALYSRLPVISTDICGFSTHVKEGEMGTVLANSDFSIPVFANAIDTILTPTCNAKLRANCDDYFHHFQGRPQNEIMEQIILKNLKRD